MQGGSNASPLQPSDRFAILYILNYHCRCIVTWHLFAANSKLVEILNQAASTCCSGDNNLIAPKSYGIDYMFEVCLQVVFTRSSQSEQILDNDLNAQIGSAGSNETVPY